jgi:hypothetical protein
MSSNSDKSVVPAYWYIKNVHKKRCKWLTHPYMTKDANRRAFIAAQELKKDEKKFQSYYRMSRHLFIELVEIVRLYIKKRTQTIGA